MLARILVAFAASMCLVATSNAATSKTPLTPRVVGSVMLDQQSLFVPGTPVQKPDSPVLVLSCGLQYQNPIGSAVQRVAYMFTIFNRLSKPLRFVTLTYRFDTASQQANEYDLEGGERREISDVVDAGVNGQAEMFLAHRPTFFLCGSGPDLAVDGTTYEDAAMFPHSLHVLRWMVPQRNGKPYTPFKTTKDVLTGGSDNIPGIPLQREAMYEQSTYTPGVPPRNLIPVIVASCGATYRNGWSQYMLSVYNQTPNARADVRISVSDTLGTPATIALTNLRGHEYRTVSWREQTSGPATALFCSAE